MSSFRFLKRFDIGYLPTFRDAAGWLPPNQAFRCEFAARQIEVKTAYGLWLSAKEKRALEQVLARC